MDDIGALIGALIIIAVLVGGAVLITGAVANITTAQAEKAQAVAQQLHEETAQVQAYQDGKTERWEAFLATLAALTSRPDDRAWVPWLCVLAVLDAVGIAYVIRTRSRPAVG